jgi:uncharacterized protein
MTKTTLVSVSADDLRSLAIGTGILGTGGGTHPYFELLNIEKLYREGRRVSLISPDDLADDDLVAELGFMGAPLVTKERLPDPRHTLKPVEMMRQATGADFRAVMAGEVGAENGVLPFLVAALLGLPVVDADCMGRAFPEMQMSSFVIRGLPLYPFAMADIRDNEILMTKAAGPLWVERINRRLCTEMGAIAATCRPPRTGRQIKDHAVHGSVSRAIRLGGAVRRARKAHTDPIATVMESEDGLLLFRGKVIDVARQTTAGFVRGRATIEGHDDFAGRSFDVDFQNEFTIGWIDGVLRVMVPDLICILDADTGEAIGTETIRYGLRVGIVAIAAADVLTSPEGLAYVGPRAFGYDMDYVSLFGPAS